MSRGPGYELLLTSGFVDDLRRLAAEARRDPGRVFLRQQALRLIDQLAAGTADGHHALGYEPGKRDLRDCVTAYLQSDPQQSADYRLVFREIGAEGRPGRAVGTGWPERVN
ncbi:hypothetical protein OG558_26630 [Kribbella sp. NBC_01510]|uniref:hypothetical protein n=1 Tax=Kribbella sp. NBC_01510 TaxID=2903581 RepID=UPI00386476A4